MSVTDKQQREWETGVVRWFDRERRFGFVIPDDGDEDVFLYWRELQRHGISEKDVLPEQRVKFTTRPPDKPGRCKSQVDAISLGEAI